MARQRLVPRNPSTGRFRARWALGEGALVVLSFAALSAPAWGAAPAGVITTVTIGGHAWLDSNCDGIRSRGEMPLAGVTVTPLGGVAATTDGNGGYAFRVGGGQAVTMTYTPPSGSGYVLAPSNARGLSDNDPVNDYGDSDPSTADGTLTVTAPPTGNDSLESPDNPYLDAGFCRQAPTGYNLALTKSVHPDYVDLALRPGSETVFRLTPRNTGTVDGKDGFRIVDLLPAELDPVSAVGENGGYACTWSAAGRFYECVSSTPLAAGATGEAVVVTGRLTARWSGSLKNVAYVQPWQGSEPSTVDVESSPLSKPPVAGTDTLLTDTDNDAEASQRFIGYACAGDRVWFDVDRDGVQDPGEPGVPGVSVQLEYRVVKSSGASWLRVGDPILTSDGSGAAAAGEFLFDTLNPYPYDMYRIVVTAPTGTSFTVPAGTSDPALDSNVSVVAVPTGTTPGFPGPTAADGVIACDRTIDVGLVSINLTLEKTVSPTNVTVGDEVTWTLIPRNTGLTDALAGWEVVDLAPTGTTVTSMSGDGYTCVDGVCTADYALGAGKAGSPITVVTRIDVLDTVRNVAYIQPSTLDVAETVPLVVPSRDVDPAGLTTDNVGAATVTAQAAVPVVPAEPSVVPTEPTELPATGAPATTLVGIGGLLLMVGIAILRLIRHRPAQETTSG